MKAVPEEHKQESSAAGAVVRRLAAAICVFLAVTVNSHAQGAQLPEPPLPIDPRPLTQLISDAEKALLAEANNPKKLVEAYLKISDAHLQAALNAINANNHIAAERELDIYNKAVAAAGKEAFALQDGKRSLSKRIEQALYKQIKTLETIERLFPSEREVFAEAALRHTKQLRVQALNEAFASGEVLKDPEGEKKPKSEPPVNEGAQINPTVPPPLARAGWLQRALGLRPPSAFLGLSSGVLPDSGASVLAAARFNSRRVSRQMPGDYLTEEEDEHVREAQAADERAKVFMKIADRRLKAIAGPAASPADKKDQKKVEEEEREWGALPKVSRVELLRHYARAISECMAKLEDAYERNPKSSALPKALSVLRDATDKHLQTLRTLKPEMKTETEVAAISGAIYEAETANKGARDGLK
ncbi:MAG TPA: hypothetical protein VI837_13875 [Blastocatellia bacterium]|nr:hypothetical protein [Blastocatellia bacterium]